MEALLIYESLYGNTAAIGEAIAASLRTHGVDVTAGPLTRFEPEQTSGFDLVVAGGPTHVHGMSSQKTRETAAHDTKNTFAEPTVTPGLREWLERLPPGTGRVAAAFDTRIDKPILLTGSAAKGIAKRLRKLGFCLPVEPECFLVDTDNYLVHGETEHATAWGRRLAEAASAAIAA